MERIFVSDSGLRPAERTRKLEQVRAYLYGGWEYSGWGSAPEKSAFYGMTGFYFTRTDDHGGPGFGAEQLLARMSTGMHFGVIVHD